MSRSPSYGTSAIRNRLDARSLELLDRACFAVAAVEHPISVRGIFYRVLTHPINVEHGLIQKTEQDNRKVQRSVLKLRRSGAMPYAWISDGTRWTISPDVYDGVDQALADLSASYRRNAWRSQAWRVEVWTEKDAMAGILSPVTDRWQMGLYVTRGFSSETFLYAAAQDTIAIGRPTLLLNVGDHDASGLRAWQDIQRKLSTFAPGIDWSFERLAVTPEQIHDLNLPERPQKATTHARDWEGGAVECDAVPTPYLRSTLEVAITSVID